METLEAVLSDLCCEVVVVAAAVATALDFSAGASLRVVSTGAGRSSTFFSDSGGLLKDSFTPFSAAALL